MRQRIANWLIGLGYKIGGGSVIYAGSCVIEGNIFLNNPSTVCGIHIGGNQ